MILTRKKKTDYINNKTFYNELVKYLDNIKDCENQGKPKPQISRYIGEAILELCTRMSYRPNFNGYTKQWKDEMISDALLNCLAVVENFNPEHEKKNPFGYFSLIAWNAFLRRIEKEKLEQYVKHKNLENMSIHDDTGYLGGELNSNEAHDYIIGSYEEKRERKKNK